MAIYLNNGFQAHCRRDIWYIYRYDTKDGWCCVGTSNANEGCRTRTLNNGHQVAEVLGPPPKRRSNTGKPWNPQEYPGKRLMVYKTHQSNYLYCTKCRCSNPYVAGQIPPVVTTYEVAVKRKRAAGVQPYTFSLCEKCAREKGLVW